MLERLLSSLNTNFPVVVSDNGGWLPADFKGRHSSVLFIEDCEVPVMKNWNRAAAAHSSEWIVMPGDDDLYYSESFSLMERVIHRNPTADIIFFGHHIINERDEIIDTWQPSPAFMRPPEGFISVKRGIPARPPSILFKSSIYKRLGGFSEVFKITAGDNDFYQRACLVGNTVFANEVVSGYRVWSDGSTAQSIATKEWLKEVDLWCNRIREFAALNANYKYSAALGDEIYIENMRAGIRLLKRQHGYISAWKHFLGNRYPCHATPLSQVKLLAHLSLP